MELKIDSFDELLEFISNNDLTNNQLNSVIFNTLNVMSIKEIGENYTKKALLKDLEKFWSEYSHKECLPLFLD
jgi:hypothetical protein|tara:strand:- start:234 stop:452 length:219 start_codon:yes stop_codon:yes gene_type:complete